MDEKFNEFSTREDKIDAGRILDRVAEFRGFAVEDRWCPPNPCLTKRECIVIADYIAYLENELTECKVKKILAMSDEELSRHNK